MNRMLTGGIIAGALCAWSLVQSASSLQSDIDAVLRRKPDLEAGERRYDTACSSCHGASGQGQLRGWAPRLSGQRYAVIVTELVGYRRGTRQDDRMQARAASHVLPGLQDIADVAAYASELRAGWGEQGSGALAGAGGQLFAARCITCHGVGAIGSDRPAVPRLATQNYTYLVRQLHDFIDGRRAIAARDHLQQLKSLDLDQIMGLADYLSRLP